ncbi:MAG: flagellar basal body P-ring protein FlgI, partial [Phycisphaerae bacterium]|nr:flagellar basal body P-ring protein FlgI [Phycisphaerae bacterium]
RGYGLVVGLNGNGSRLMPADVRAHILQEMARRGVGNPAMNLGTVSPERMLDSEDCAVVIVEGVIPPGAPKNAAFDVRVFAVPGSGTSSLEGGRLWTTDLRPGPLVTGSRQARALAEARGDVFINPFVEPNAMRRDAVNRLSGRILDGGSVMNDMLLRLRMATTSHSRAETIKSSINSLFPRERGQRDETARGRAGDAIDITVPPSYHDRPEEFVQLIQHTPLLIEAPEQTAMYVRRALLATPGMAEAASWRWRAIGKKAVPMIQDLYAYPEEQPRMAALVAGAELNDPLTVQPLLAMAKLGEVKNRLTAIELLGKMGLNPAIDLGLRPLLDDADVDVRLGAFDALEERRDPILGQLTVDEKFDLVVVPSEKPMLYIAQTGRPRIIVFGPKLSIENPMTFAAWSNRLMMKADLSDETIQVFWRPIPDGPAEQKSVEPALTEFIPFLGHQTTIEKPAMGLGLTYSETIGALHQLWKKSYLKADFKAEQDRILASIIRSQKPEEALERPEFDDLGDTVESGSAAKTVGPSDDSDLAHLVMPDAPVTGASGATVIERSAIQRDTVPR